MSYLLDTNVLSELNKATPDPRVVRWQERHERDDAYVSVLVLGEVKYGIELLRRGGDEQQANRFDTWLASLREIFAERLLDVTVGIAEHWAALHARRPLPIIDGLQAATALEHDLTFVTRDAAPLAGSSVRVLNPWGE